jgi:hypothetical protein
MSRSRRAFSFRGRDYTTLSLVAASRRGARATTVSPDGQVLPAQTLTAWACVPGERSVSRDHRGGKPLGFRVVNRDDGGAQGCREEPCREPACQDREVFAFGHRDAALRSHGRQGRCAPLRGTRTARSPCAQSGAAYWPGRPRRVAAGAPDAVASTCRSAPAPRAMGAERGGAAKSRAFHGREWVEHARDLVGGIVEAAGKPG